MKLSKAMCCLGVSLILCACKRVEDTSPYEKVETTIFPQIAYQALRPAETTIATTEQIEFIEVPIPKLIEYGALPECPTNMYFIMDYRKITDKSSAQWELQHDSRVSTDVEGFRKFDDEYYIVALAENYGKEIGQTWEVVLDNGTEFKIIQGECKSAGDKNYTPFGHKCINYDQEDCINVIEFVIDEKIYPYSLQRYGSASGMDKFNGNIIEMRGTGKIW